MCARIQRSYINFMVKRVKSYSKRRANKQKASETQGRDGRPNFHQMDIPYGAIYSDVCDIVLIISAISKKYYLKNPLQNTHQHHCSKDFESSFDYQKLCKSNLTLEERLKYGDKHSLPYFVHHFMKEKTRRDWKCSELFDVIQYWLYQQDLVPNPSPKLKEEFQYFTKENYTSELFKDNQAGDESLMNLMVILGLELMIFEGRQLIIETKNDQKTLGTTGLTQPEFQEQKDAEDFLLIQEQVRVLQRYGAQIEERFDEITMSILLQ